MVVAMSFTFLVNLLLILINEPLILHLPINKFKS